MKQFSLLLLLALLFTFSACDDDDAGPSASIVATFKANYDNQPFVVGDTYTYEDNTPIFFTRLNFFISNISLIATDGNITELSEIELVDFTNQNIDASGANEGYIIDLPATLEGEFTGIKFGIGVSDSLNATTPNNYSSSHPLGSVSDYWSAWESFIFGKLEGKVDVNLDGTFTSGIVYHTGGNEYYNEIQLDAPFTIDANNTMLPTINIDIKKLLVRSENDYLDIINNSAVHTDGDLMQYVVQNYLQAIKVQ